MLESLPFMVLLGTLLGFLSGIGIGGGSLLVLWLTLVVDTPVETARVMNLLFFIPSALIACFFRWKQGILDIRQVLPAIVSGCICAALFSWLGTHLNTSLLKKLFGGLLVLTGIHEIRYKNKT